LLLASAIHHPHDVGKRAGHARAETRVLVEDGGQERGAEAPAAGNEVELPSWLRNWGAAGMLAVSCGSVLWIV